MKTLQIKSWSLQRGINLITHKRGYKIEGWANTGPGHIKSWIRWIEGISITCLPVTPTITSLSCLIIPRIRRKKICIGWNNLIFQFFYYKYTCVEIFVNITRYIGIQILTTDYSVHLMKIEHHCNIYNTCPVIISYWKRELM